MQLCYRGSSSQAGHSFGISGSCAWMWTEGSWVLVDSDCAPGFVCPGAPIFTSGQFEGEIIRCICVPADSSKA